jgi:nicotinamidase-related amidase
MTEHDPVSVSRRRFVAASGALGIVGAMASQAAPAEPLQSTDQMTDADYDRLPRDAGHEPLALVPARTALLVIDMQRYFVHPNYTFGQTTAKVWPGITDKYFPRVKDIVVPNCQKLQRVFRDTGGMIVYTAFGSLREHGLDMPRWAREDNALSRQVVGKPMYPCATDPSWQVDDSLAPLPGELVLAKTSSGPLNSTKLDQTFHTLRIDSLVVTGVVTNVCVTQTAREFADRDFQVVVVADACATMTDDDHHAALRTFNDVFGHVRTTDAVIKLLS